MIVWAVPDCAGHSFEVINRFLEEALPRTRGFTGVRKRDSLTVQCSSAHARVHRRDNRRGRGGRRFFRARAGSGLIDQHARPDERGPTSRLP
jgi:hypothetical protein